MQACGNYQALLLILTSSLKMQKTAQMVMNLALREMIGVRMLPRIIEADHEHWQCQGNSFYAISKGALLLLATMFREIRMLCTFRCVSYLSSLS
jgi:hypothetical protein